MVWCLLMEVSTYRRCLSVEVQLYKLFIVHVCVTLNNTCFWSEIWTQMEYAFPGLNRV